MLLDLVREADVFITNLLPDRRRRFRLDPEDLFAVNPGLVYGRASGHGDHGPERAAGGYDHTDFWARTGIGHAASMVVGRVRPPARAGARGSRFGDLPVRRHRGRPRAQGAHRAGRAWWTSRSSGPAYGWCSPGVVASQLYGIDNIPRYRHADLPNPLVAAYATRDNRLIYMSGIQTEGHFEKFCTRIGRKDLLDDPRFATGTAR